MMSLKNANNVFFILLILQGCQAQDKKDENDIEEIQKKHMPGCRRLDTRS
jgi:hypothetical protein